MIFTPFAALALVPLILVRVGVANVHAKVFPMVAVTYGMLVGHFFWAGIGPGKVHDPTAWRCVAELKRGGQPVAAKLLAVKLKAEGREFATAHRSGEAYGLGEFSTQDPVDLTDLL